MKFSIIGQSNSILPYGFAACLERLGYVPSKKGVLGASPSIIGPYFSSGDFFVDQEACLLDFCVVDQVYLWAGTANTYLIGQWLTNVIHRAKIANCVPIFILIPHAACVEGSSAIYDFYKAFATNNNCHFIDVREYIKTRAAIESRNISDYYTDPNHVTEEVSAEIAKSIINLFKQIKSSPKKTRTILASYPHFEILNLPKLKNIFLNRVVTHSNSLLSKEYYRLEYGDVVALYTGTITRVSGIVFNGAASYSTVTIKGDETSTKNLATRLAGDKSKHRMQIIPFIQPFSDNEGRLIVSNEGIQSSECTYQSVEPSNLGASEVAALIIERTLIMRTYSCPWFDTGSLSIGLASTKRTKQ